MLESVGHPVAVNPDKALRRHALEHGWTVRDFHHPIPLRTRVDTPASRVAVVLLSVAALAVGAWLLLRRRPRRP